MAPRPASAASGSDSAATRAVRVSLAREIAGIVSSRGLTQCQAAELLGTSQPKVSALLAGKVEGFSIDRLVRFLNALGEDVHIVVLPSATGPLGATSRVLSATEFVQSAGRWSYA